MTIFLTSLTLSVLACLIVPVVLRRTGFLDMPGERSSHTRPTPKGGGLGIVLGASVGALSLGLPSALWVPAVAVALLSFWNDLHSIPPRARLAVQGVCAVWALIGLQVAGLSSASCVLLPAMVLCIMATANCYNFMDGINGLAGITAVIAFGGLAMHAWTRQHDLAVFCLAIAGGAAGFLPFNVPRARVFMGDVGSIFLGFVFALLALVLARTGVEFLVLTAFLFPFYADEAASVLERVWRGESLLDPHRRHLYQFLANERGLAHWKVSVGYGMLQLLIMLLAVRLADQGGGAILGLFCSLGAAWMTCHFGLKWLYGEFR